MAGLQRNVPEWVQAMDVFVHASDQEPFGIVIIEAMALGKPVIAGNAGGPTEIITDGVNGLLTAYDDAEALTEAILRYLDDQEFAQSAGIAARQRALQFSTQRYAQNFINTIGSIMPNIVTETRKRLPL
jgi:glycosyltransferase involved in cell wall biosynthesis